MTVLTSGITALLCGCLSIIASQFIDPNKPKKKPHHVSEKERQAGTFTAGVGLMIIGIVLIIIHLLSPT